MSGFDYVVEGLADHGWALCHGFLDGAEIEALAALSRERRATFQHAGIGRAAGRALDTAIRGDDVLWLDEGDPDAQALLERLADLQATLNRSLYLGLATLECHFAAYPAGAFYKRHLDQHRGQDTRAVTVVLYLNRDWLPEHGGQLRLYTEAGPVDVQPQGGTLVVFLSDRFEHEVMPANRERLSVSGWFRRREAAVL
ncbi:2OG-Fe(II) oxygenase [Chitiniphilus eburneus]|uniref:2OG-Fe(II) oxygenase n=1 Tax=Chitiniphilus eburneus TaxID=2571148 RepID=UPI001B7FA0C1|nr:2OG-Fe(II) oxygenase [Chitiniphilus eburneus]